MNSRYKNNQTAPYRTDSEEECFLREQRIWTKKRMDVLELIEEKLNQIRILALYVVEHKLNEHETGQIQSEVDDLLRDISFLNQEEAQVCH